MTPEQEIAGLEAWRKKIDQRLAELKRQQAEREGLDHFVLWRELRREPRRERR